MLPKKIVISFLLIITVAAVILVAGFSKHEENMNACMKRGLTKEKCELIFE